MTICDRSVYACGYYVILHCYGSSFQHQAIVPLPPFLFVVTHHDTLAFSESLWWDASVQYLCSNMLLMVREPADLSETLLRLSYSQIVHPDLVLLHGRDMTPNMYRFFGEGAFWFPTVQNMHI